MAFTLALGLFTGTAYAQEPTVEISSTAIERQSGGIAYLPSKPLVGTGSGTITNSGFIDVSLYNNPQKVTEIWILGNKTGGGASTSAGFYSNVTSNWPSADIDGTWQQIYSNSSGINVSGGSISFFVNISPYDDTTYNIAILVY